MDQVMPPVMFMFLSLIFLSPLGERLGEGVAKAVRFQGVKNLLWVPPGYASRE